MGFGTYHTHTYYFSHETYTEKQGVLDAIEDDGELIGRYKDRLKALALMTEPQKFFDSGNCLQQVQDEVSGILESLEELFIHQQRLYDLYYDWDESHTEIAGKEFAIEAPKEIRKKDEVTEIMGDGTEVPHTIYGHTLPFVDGDFIPSVYPDGTVSEGTKWLMEEQKEWDEFLAKRYPNPDEIPASLKG